MRRHAWKRTISAGVVAAAALLAGAGVAQADPPSGWGPGPGGVEYDFADIGWTHHGRYDGQLGNWHTGYVTVEEDDDGITGELVDWRCPTGVQPPSPYTPDQATQCKQKSSVWLEYTQFWDVAQFDQARNRLEVHQDVPAYDDAFDQVGVVRLDLVIKGLGQPEIVSDESGEILDYSETFDDIKAWGRVDDHRIAGPNTQQASARMGFWLDGWERTA